MQYDANVKREDDLELDDLKSDPAIVKLFLRDANLRQSGPGYIGRCPHPSHQDLNASFSVFQDSGGTWLFKCFGCKSTGNIFQFQEWLHGTKFPEAKQEIKDFLGYDKEQSGTKDKSRITSRIAPTAGKQHASKYNKAVTIERFAEAEAYLKAHGVTPEVAKAHDVGVDVGSFPSLGPCITFPYDETNVKLRSLQRKEFRHYPETSTAGLFYNFEAIDRDDPKEIFITESERDCLMMVSHGFPAISVSSATVCQTGDTLKFKPEDLAKLRQVKSIYIAVDQDKEGKECAAALQKALVRARILTWQYGGKESSDPKDLGEIYTSDPAHFKERIAQLLIPELWRIAPSFAVLPEKQRKWVVPDLVPEDEITLLTGDFGCFKSYLALFMADAIAGGLEFVERPCPKQPVLLLDRENSHSTLYLRRSLVGELKTRANVKILGLFTDPPAPELTDPRLLEVCRRIKPVIIVDSLIDFHIGLKESDPDDMAACFLNIRALITAGALAVIVLHHVPKNGTGRGGSYRGTTSIPAAGSYAFLVKKDGNRVTLGGFKARDSGEQQIELDISFGLEAVTYSVTNSGKDPQAELHDQIQLQVRLYPNCTTQNIAKNLGKRKEDVTAAINDMLRIGRLFRSGPGKGGRGSGLTANPEALDLVPDLIN